MKTFKEYSIDKDQVLHEDAQSMLMYQKMLEKQMAETAKALKLPPNSIPPHIEFGGAKIPILTQPTLRGANGEYNGFWVTPNFDDPNYKWGEQTASNVPQFPKIRDHQIWLNQETHSKGVRGNPTLWHEIKHMIDSYMRSLNVDNAKQKEQQIRSLPPETESRYQALGSQISELRGHGKEVPKELLGEYEALFKQRQAASAKADRYRAGFEWAAQEPVQDQIYLRRASETSARSWEARPRFQSEFDYSMNNRFKEIVAAQDAARKSQAGQVPKWWVGFQGEREWRPEVPAPWTSIQAAEEQFRKWGQRFAKGASDRERGIVQGSASVADVTNKNMKELIDYFSTRGVPEPNTPLTDEMRQLYKQLADMTRTRESTPTGNLQDWLKPRIDEVIANNKPNVLKAQSRTAENILATAEDMISSGEVRQAIQRLIDQATGDRPSMGVRTPSQGAYTPSMSSVGMASGMNPSASADLVAMTFNSMDTPTNRNTRAKAIAGNPNATDENEQADAQAAVAGQSSESGMEYTPGVNSPGTMQRVEQLRNKEAEDWQKKYGTSLIGAKLYGILNKARNAKQSKVPDPDGGVNGIPGPGIGGFDDEPTPPVSVIPWRRAMMLGNDNQSSDSNTSTPTGSNSNGSGDNSVPPSGGGDNKGGGGGSNGGNGGNGGSGGGGGGDNEDDEDKKGTSGRKFPLPFSIAQPVNENIKTFLEYVNKNVPDSEDIEMELVDELKSANDEDLKEYPGERGETAHKNLHSKIKSFINTMEKMHESKDGDYEGLPEEKPMSDKELDDYYKSYTKDKKKLKKNK